jgi:hypothetical protein
MERIRLKRNSTDCLLLMSCLGDGDTGGGLLLYDGETTRIIDRTASTGLTTHGNTVARIFWAPHQEQENTRIQIITPHGYRIVDLPGFTDPHDLFWTGREYAAVSSLDDCILWVDPYGSVVRRCQFGGGGDAWHLNCLVTVNGRLLATAFGRYSTPRGWHERRHEAGGMLFDVNTGEDILTGLHCPHSPRIEPEGLYLCCSMPSEVTLYDWRTLAPIRQVRLEGWTRGLAVTDDFILVGESVNRNQSSETRGATVAVLDRDNLKLRSRFQLPFREVYDLLPVRSDLVPDALPGADQDVLNEKKPLTFSHSNRGKLLSR